MCFLSGHTSLASVKSIFCCIGKEKIFFYLTLSAVSMACVSAVPSIGLDNGQTKSYGTLHEMYSSK